MMLRPLVLTATVIVAAAPCRAASFAGVPVVSGGTVRAEVPLDATERSYVTEGGNPVPPHAVALLAVPAGFDPAKRWPVLVVLATSDFKRQNRDDLEQFYREPALAEGWAVIAGDGPAPPPRDTAGWRAGMTLAALDALHRSFPGAKSWPVAVAGFSGGAKRAGTIAPLLARAGCRLIGIFLTGINEDRLSEGYAKFKPGAAFLRTPVFVSTGRDDPVATFDEQQRVKQSMERTGFTRVRQEVFAHRHAVSRSQVRTALRWFREQGG